MDSGATRSLKTQYLILYNLVSAVLWVAVLGRVILLVPLVGFENVHGGVGEFAKWTQTLAVLEVVHSALGRSSIFLKGALRILLLARVRCSDPLGRFTLLMMRFPHRSCPLPPAHNRDASLFPPASHLARRPPLPPAYLHLPILQHHAARLVRLRGHPLLLLCAQPAGLGAGVCDVV